MRAFISLLCYNHEANEKQGVFVPIWRKSHAEQNHHAEQLSGCAGNEKKADGPHACLRKLGDAGRA